MINYTIPKDIEKDAKVYMQNVLEQLDSTGMLENVDSAALTMLARNIDCIYNHRTTKTNQKYPSVNL